MISRYLKKPFKFDCLDQWLKKSDVKVLDIGCGNHSPSLTKSYYPQCHYYGLDRSRSYNLNEKDFASIEQFFEIDLQKDHHLSEVPDNFFDCIIVSHVIEHLGAGEEIVSSLCKKLKQNRVLYLEFPSLRSPRLPAMRRPFFGDSLNFYDDPTHVRLYQPSTLEECLQKSGCKILESKHRRSWKQIVFFPVYAIGSLVYLHYLSGGIFWDMTGFAYYIVAQKADQK